MTRPITASSLAVLLAAVGVWAPEAAADHDRWRFGARLLLGNVHLAIGFAPVPYGPPTYYYRTPHQLRATGHRCGDRCHRRGGDWYHHESCPVVLALFHRHGLGRHAVFSRYAPAYDGRWARHDARGHGGYGRYDGRARYERHHRDDRYGRGGRYDRHRRYEGSRGYDRYDDDRGRDRRGRHQGRGHGRGHDCDGRHHRH
jgi:hypothetical protein